MYMYYMQIGMIAGSYKPFHSGHFECIKLAASECDEVHLFVSLSDRKRPGEVPIFGKDMEKIWHEELEKILPQNVLVSYGGSPIQQILKEIGDASKSYTENTYIIYADAEDLAKNFNEDILQKYAGWLYGFGQLKLRDTSSTRGESEERSGTAMRKFIEDNDKESFINNMSPGVDGDKIWNLLRSRVVIPDQKITKKKKASESIEVLLKSLIKETVSHKLRRAFF